MPGDHLVGKDLNDGRSVVGLNGPPEGQLARARRLHIPAVVARSLGVRTTGPERLAKPLLLDELLAELPVVMMIDVKKTRPARVGRRRRGQNFDFGVAPSGRVRCDVPARAAWITGIGRQVAR